MQVWTSGVSCFSLMPLFPVICNTAAWACPESKLVWYSVVKESSTETCSPGRLDLDFPSGFFCVAFLRHEHHWIQWKRMGDRSLGLWHDVCCDARAGEASEPHVLRRMLSARRSLQGLASSAEGTVGRVAAACVSQVSRLTAWLKYWESKCHRSEILCPCQHKSSCSS